MALWTGKNLKEHLFSESEKLGILRRTDPFREWGSLDETRFCILCEKTFRGRDVCVAEDAAGAVILLCPTPACPGSPYEWVPLGNPLFSEEAYQEWERITTAAAAVDREALPIGFALLKRVFIRGS